MTPRPPVEENAMIGTKPYAKLKYREVKGRQMAYIDEGEGDAIPNGHWLELKAAPESWPRRAEKSSSNV